MGVLFLGTFNSSVDNTVHLYGVFTSILFYAIEKFQIKYKYFFIPSIIYGVVLFWLTNFQNKL